MNTVLEQEIRSATSKCVGPLLESGLHLSQEEFHWRYELTPNVRKAELVKGIVYMGSPISKWHSGATLMVGACLGTYAAAIKGLEAGNAGSIILDSKNEFQPDVYLRLNEKLGGQTRVAGSYLSGAPELIVEIAYSSGAYDLHEKLEVYEQHRVREYLVWHGEKNQFNCFRLDNKGRFAPVAPYADGVFRSELFPGMWLNLEALMSEQLQAALETVQKGISSPEAKQFIERLEAASK